MKKTKRVIDQNGNDFDDDMAVNNLQQAGRWRSHKE